MNCDALKEFKDFMARVIDPSLNDIETLNDKSRVHIQKLVYTNLVDRFDSTIDHFFRDNVRHPDLLTLALKDANDPITQKDLFELLLQGSNLEEILDEKLREGISNTITRNNHASKLRDLFRLCAPSAQAHGTTPRVNISTGEIVEKFKPQKGSKQPSTIIGYADWIYARRNSIVHGAGSSSFLERDKKRIQKTHNVSVADTFKIKLGSIQLTRKFYAGLVSLIEENLAG